MNPIQRTVDFPSKSSHPEGLERTLLIANQAPDSLVKAFAMSAL